MPWYYTLLIAVITAFLGYFIASIRHRRENQFRIYGDILPIFIDFAYNEKNRDSKVFNEILAKVWLYCSKEVAIKMDGIVAIMAGSSDVPKVKWPEKVQELITAMRQDIWTLNPMVGWEVPPKDIKHFHVQ